MKHIFTISASEKEEFEVWKKEHDAKVRADAIDEFADLLKEKADEDARRFNTYTFTCIDEVAEQLKEQNK